MPTNEFLWFNMGMHWTPFADRRFLAAYGYTLIVIGAIVALAHPFLNLFPPEDVASARVSISVAGGIIVLLGLNILWIALGRQPKSVFLRRARVFLFPGGQMRKRIIRDKKSKVIVIWFLVVYVLMPLTVLAGVIEHENNGRAWVSVILTIIIAGLALLSLALFVSLLVRIWRMTPGEFDD